MMGWGFWGVGRGEGGDGRVLYTSFSIFSSHENTIPSPSPIPFPIQPFANQTPIHRQMKTFQSLFPPSFQFLFPTYLASLVDVNKTIQFPPHLAPPPPSPTPPTPPSPPEMDFCGKREEGGWIEMDRNWKILGRGMEWNVFFCFYFVPADSQKLRSGLEGCEGRGREGEKKWLKTWGMHGVVFRTDEIDFIVGSLFLPRFPMCSAI